MQRKPSKTPRRQESSRVSPPPAASTPRPLAPPPAPAPAIERSQDEAIGEILAGLPDVVRSVRVLVVGASQRGKTTFARRLCGALADRGHGGSLVVFDQKFPDRAQYEGREVATLEALYSALADHEPTIVCRAPLTAEDAAAAVRAAAETGDAATLLGDEIQPMLRLNRDTGEPMERVWAGPSLVWLCLQGGGLGGSLVQLCQLPRMVPGSLVDNATATVFFTSGGRSLEYSLDLKLLPRDAAAAVARLEIGQCCVFLPDRQWDGAVYGPA